MIRMCRALISVYDKSEINKLCSCLLERNFEIVATTGTKSILPKHERIYSVDQIYGFISNSPKVKTLHPRIFEDILEDGIDLVVCNLYKSDMDIGGHALIRAAIKGKKDILIDPKYYIQYSLNMDIDYPNIAREYLRNYN